MAGIHHISVGIGGEFLGHHHIIGQYQAHIALQRTHEDIGSHIQLVQLTGGVAHLAAERPQEGIAHGAADDDGVALIDEGVDDADLVGDLGAAGDGHKGAGRVGEGLADHRNFLLNQKAADGGEIGRHAGGGAVSSVGGAESVIHIHIGIGSQLLGKGRIILFLFLMETDIFQHDDLTGLDSGAQAVGILPDHIVGQSHRHFQQLGQAVGHRLQGILGVILALGAPQMGYDDDSGTAGDQIAQGGQSPLNASFIGQMPILVNGGVEIAADQHFFAAHIDIAHGLFVEVHHDNPSSPATLTIFCLSSAAAAGCGEGPSQKEKNPQSAKTPVCSSLFCFPIHCTVFSPEVQALCAIFPRENPVSLYIFPGFRNFSAP